MATSYAAAAAEQKKKNDEIYNKQAEQIIKTYDASIKEIGTAYDEQQRANAVQKLINERKVAESMANLGTTDSGLNRTQQTAVQLSAANQAYALNRQKQANIDKYNLERDSRLSTIEQNRIATAAEIDQTYESMAASASTAQAQANNNVITTPTGNSGLLMSTTGKLNPNYTGTLGQNSIAVDYVTKPGYTIYTDYATGITKEIKSDFNPYTGTRNPDVDDGVFSNGYQPDNIKGEKLKMVDKGAWTYFGQAQNVASTGSGKNTKYWVWSRGTNSYVEVYKENGQWKLKEDLTW